MLTTTQAAERLGVTKARVIHLIHAGRLRATPVSAGGRVLAYAIDPADLAAVRRRPPGRPRKENP